MNEQINQALEAALKNWSMMSSSNVDDAEGAADQFESSFYAFIDTVRDWAYTELKPMPQTVEQFLDLPLVIGILERLPAPLHLNFETEAELIVDQTIRIDDEKYD
ncbi:hypothetical protein [Bacillus sp. FJAT-26390]|uniref:hypothetical protein n=1 Tax=Bacillus sp. FJAT-26390 TaxID=1743142 RepID=UPI000807FF7C|nr:hypothetical protein [Bacillus sp. FJAT-26390]OBZ16536.1 hypothetical protein A7975_01010 [Bacillus sp. FJAT-26390]